MPFIFLIIIPVIVAFLAFALPTQIRFIRRISLVGSVLFFLGTIGHALWVFSFPDQRQSIQPWFLFDALGAFMTLIVGWVFMTAMFVSHKYLIDEEKLGHSDTTRVAHYYGFAFLFALAMILTLAADHMIMMWVALESSTLATTLLVAYNGKRRSLEAAWKYIVLCSTGLLVGLLGILLFFVALSGGSKDEVASILQFSHFLSLATIPTFDVEFLKIAFILLCVGIGTKVGLVPVHNWLPDAHGETPAPISAMLSGVLLSVALIVLVRFKFIIDGLLGDSSWTNHFFIFFGVLSVLYAALMTLRQKNYKRLLAYSSIEHMGIATFGFALGPIGMIAALLHIAGHAILKPLLFFASGEILHSYHTTHIGEIHGLRKRMPKTSTIFLFGLLGLLAMPPSVLFLSELIILTQGTQSALIPTLLVGVGLVIASYGLLRGFFDMSKESTHTDEHDTGREKWTSTHIVMVAQMILLVSLSGFALTHAGQQMFLMIINSVIFHVV